MRIGRLGTRDPGRQRQRTLIYQQVVFAAEFATIVRVGRQTSSYKRPKVFGEKCLGGGISPSRSTVCRCSCRTKAVYVRYRPEADIYGNLICRCH